MKKKGKKKMLMIGIAIIGIIAIVMGICFFADRKEAANRFAVYEEKAESIMTSYGKLSYIDEGSGEAILSCHGICGGYDQAYDTLAGKENQYRIIAPSRFGYPGSDMPKDATIEMQAEAFVELLDALELEQVYVLATSAGGTSAIQFAMSYPERTKGLILYCSAYPGVEEVEKELTIAGPPGFICSDFAMWLISPLFQPLMGMPQSTIKGIMPMDGKKQGIVFDGKITNTVMVNHYKDYDMSELKMPVLIIHAKDDKLAGFETVEKWSERIPDCTFVPLEGGGHLMKGNEELVDKTLDEFVKAKSIEAVVRKIEE